MVQLPMIFDYFCLLSELTNFTVATNAVNENATICFASFITHGQRSLAIKACRTKLLILALAYYKNLRDPFQKLPTHLTAKEQRQNDHRLDSSHLYASQHQCSGDYWTYITTWYTIKYKKAVLSQRWPRNAPYRPTWCPKKIHDSLTTPKASIPNIFHGLLFRSTLRMFLQNLKYKALPVTPKNWAAPGYTHVAFSPKFLMGLYSHWPCKCTRQIWSP